VSLTLDSPQENFEAGISTTADQDRREKKGVVAIPIQALAVASRKDLELKPPKARN